MAKLCPLFSGSDGNCTYISSRGNGFLVDAGYSAKRIVDALTYKGIDISLIRGIFITHEHSDHISGLKTLVKKLKVPVIASSTTLSTLAAKDALPEGCQVIAADDGVVLADTKITRFATSHDCLGSSGYRFDLPCGTALSVCTDLGIVTPEVLKGITGCRGILIESNHDIGMLKNGPYPYELKLRIGSDTGHLSNNACAAMLPGLLKSGTTRFILGHISRNNNRYDLALSCAKSALIDSGAIENSDYLISAANQSGAGELPL